MTDHETSHRRPDRLPVWVALMIFSIVVLAAMCSRGFSGGDEKFVVALGSISLTVSLLSIAGYLVPHIRHAIIGEKPEGAVAVFLLILWCCGLPVIMAPERTIAVTVAENGLNFVWNANLYFFSWASFICIAFICGSLIRENIVGAQDMISSITPKLGKWFMLIVASLVVMSSAAQFQKSQCVNVDSSTCTSNKYAISVGAIAFVLGLCVSILAYMGSLSIYFESGTALFLFILYTAGVGVITFDFGSGVTIGNLYFSTWAGFMIAIFLLVECYQGVMEQNAHPSTGAHVSEHKNGTDNGIPVEPIPEEDDI